MRAHPRQGTQITATLARASLCSCCEEVCTAEAKVVIMWGSGRIITPLRIRHALPQNFNEMARLSSHGKSLCIHSLVSRFLKRDLSPAGRAICGRGGGGYKMLKFLLQLKIQGHHLIGKLQTVESGVAGWANQGRNTELWGIPLVVGWGA